MKSEDIEWFLIECDSDGSLTVVPNEDVVYDPQTLTKGDTVKFQCENGNFVGRVINFGDEASFYALKKERDKLLKEQKKLSKREMSFYEDKPRKAFLKGQQFIKEITGKSTGQKKGSDSKSVHGQKGATAKVATGDLFQEHLSQDDGKNEVEKEDKPNADSKTQQPINSSPNLECADPNHEYLKETLRDGASANNPAADSTFYSKKDQEVHNPKESPNKPEDFSSTDLEVSPKSKRKKKDDRNKRKQVEVKPPLTDPETEEIPKEKEIKEKGSKKASMPDEGSSSNQSVDSEIEEIKEKKHKKKGSKKSSKPNEGSSSNQSVDSEIEEIREKKLKKKSSRKSRNKFEDSSPNQSDSDLDDSPHAKLLRKKALMKSQREDLQSLRTSNSSSSKGVDLPGNSRDSMGSTSTNREKSHQGRKSLIKLLFYLKEDGARGNSPNTAATPTSALTGQMTKYSAAVPGVVTLLPGIYVDEDSFATIKSADAVNKLARDVFRAVFKRKVLLRCSLGGGTPRGLGKGEPPRPGLNSNIVNQLLKYILERQLKKWKPALTLPAIKTSLRSMLVEMRAQERKRLAKEEQKKD